jgi:hypothetical protein
VQPADGYPDNAARFFVGYYKAADGTFGRNYKNNSRWVRTEIREPNADPTISITSPIDESRYPVGTTIDLLAETSDADGDSVAVSWTANNVPIAAPWTPATGIYNVVARANDGKGGVTTDSVTLDVFPISKPAAPVMQPPVVQGTTVYLAWSNVADETGYEVGRRKYTLSQTCKSLVIFRTRSANVTTTKNTIRAGGKYCYAVRAFNSLGASEWSTTIQVTLTP